MNILYLVTFILALWFIVTNATVELLRRKTDNPWIQPISAYLTGEYSEVQDAGFYGLAVGLVVLAVSDMPLFLWSIPLLVAAVALVLVVETKRLQVHAIVDSVRYQELERIHLACAGVAFVTVTLAEFYRSYMEQSQLIFFPLAAVALAALFSIFKLRNTTPLEKTYTGLILVWLLIWIAPQL